jgi:hypothetical protein
LSRWFPWDPGGCTDGRMVSTLCSGVNNNASQSISG